MEAWRHGGMETWRHAGMEHGGMEAWRHGGMEACRHGGMEAWRHGGMPAWRHGGMEAWRHGGMEAWRHAGMEAWKHGSMEAWRHGGMPAWKHGGMPAWKHGGMEAWRHAGMEAWRHGGIPAWKHGGMEPWKDPIRHGRTQLGRPHQVARPTLARPARELGEARSRTLCVDQRKRRTSSDDVQTFFQRVVGPKKQHPYIHGQDESRTATPAVHCRPGTADDSGESAHKAFQQHQAGRRPSNCRSWRDCLSLELELTPHHASPGAHKKMPRYQPRG